MSSAPPLYKFWAEYPVRDVEYVRWYPPTLQSVDAEEVGRAISRGPNEGAFYLHIPFCKDVCPYCPFNKFRMREDRAQAFVKGVLREISLVGALRDAAGTRTTGGYFGGGTPTALDTPDLLKIVEHCQRTLRPDPRAELTIEANPDTVTLEKLRDLRAAGINRISFGVQSFQDQFLSVLGRTHGAAGAITAIELARRAGFDNIAIDLIYRVPGQTARTWEVDLDRAIELGVEHISTYCLFLDPGTRLYNDTLAGNVDAYPNEAEEVAMYRVTQERLGGAGYRHYTINDFALDGRASEHHLMNWQAPQRTYAGMGPGAFSYVEGQEAVLYCTIHSLREYLAALEVDKLPIRLANSLNLAERQCRFMVLGLRCLAVSKSAFHRRFSTPMNTVFGDTIRRLEDWGLVEETSDDLRMTEKGRHYASNVLKAFYSRANYGKPQAIGVELLAGKGLSLISVTS